MRKPFTATSLKNIKPTEKKQRIADAGAIGLYFVVEALPSNIKSFAYRYTFDSKKKQISLGRYPVLTLADARAKVLELQKLIAAGIDPKAKRVAIKEEKKKVIEVEKAKTEEQELTFSKAYDDYCQYKTTPPNASQPSAWTYDTLRKHNNRMVKHVLPVIGDKPLAKVTTSDLEDVLLKIQEHGTLANRDKVKTLFNGLFDFCTYTYKHPLSGEKIFQHNIAKLISSTPFIKQQSTSFRHVVTVKELGLIVKQIENMAAGYEVKQAIKLGMMLFLRPSNIVEMRWSQIDFEDATVTYSAEQMKMRNPFTSPLPKQAIELLKEVHKLTGHTDFVFYSNFGTGKPISRDSLTNALKRNDIDITSHGFRHSASTILNEMRFNADIIEAQLSHQAKGVRGVYNKAVYLDERREMLQKWADLLESLKE